jgi:hypothetical protein
MPLYRLPPTNNFGFGFNSSALIFIFNFIFEYNLFNLKHGMVLYVAVRSGLSNHYDDHSL